MEIESPADAWYVWVGVAIVSIAVAGVVLGLPGEPPPDANKAANTVDRVAASQYGTQVSYETDAEYARFGTRQIALRNDGGTDHASVAFGSMTPVAGATGETHRVATALLAGTEPGAAISASRKFRSEAELRDAFREIRHTIDQNGSEWRKTEGRMQIRSVRIADEMIVLVDA